MKFVFELVQRTETRLLSVSLCAAFGDEFCFSLKKNFSIFHVVKIQVMHVLFTCIFVLRMFLLLFNQLNDPISIVHNESFCFFFGNLMYIFLIYQYFQSTNQQNRIVRNKISDVYVLHS